MTVVYSTVLHFDVISFSDRPCYTRQKTRWTCNHEYICSQGWKNFGQECDDVDIDKHGDDDICSETNRSHSKELKTCDTYKGTSWHIKQGLQVKSAYIWNNHI